MDKVLSDMWKAAKKAEITIAETILECNVEDIEYVKDPKEKSIMDLREYIDSCLQLLTVWENL